VDARERWQALQAHLTAARQAIDRGDQAAALLELNAALAIDPEFAAALALRDRIGMPELPLADPAGRGAPDAVEAPPLFSDAPRIVAATPRPLVSAEGFARFEQRAKRRRIDRRADAARSAIAERRLRDAAVAIDEIRELDPDAPEIAPLAFALAAASQPRARRRRWHVGPQVAAAAAFAAIVLVSWVQQPQPRGLLSYPMSIVSALVSTAQPAPLIATMSPTEEPPVGTSGDVASEAHAEAAEPLAMSPRPPLNASLTDVVPSIAPAPPPTPAPAPATNVSTTPPAVVPAAVSVAALETTPPPPAVLPASAPETTIVESKPPDDALVRRTLQQYKNAYDALDARSAQAVWPAVNERALARAFDGLESQNVIFDACDVQVTGDLARALCRGITRYVAKVGSHEPRTEPRIWNFTLRRTGPDWKIESARAEK
jgi:hypothetical protein